MSVSDQKKKQIINAAITEFQEKGYSGASMDRISERAQVSKRTVYNHFDSKDALFRAINQRLADQINAALEFTFDPDQPIRDALVALGWTQGDLIVQPDFIRLARLITSETIRNPDLASDMSSRINKFSIYQEFMKAATVAGQLTVTDPDSAAAQFLGLIKSRSYYPALNYGTLCTKEAMAAIIEDAVDMFLARYDVSE